MDHIIPYGKQYISDEDIEAVIKSLKAEYLTQGPLIIEFENKFADYIGVKYAVAVTNGTAALHLAAMALQVDSTTNVITTPITFAASANCIRYCNGNVYFADIDPQTYSLDIDGVEALIKSKPKGFFSGIIPVDFAGYTIHMESLNKIASKHGLWIIEDACHAPGGYFNNSNGAETKAGSCVYSDLAVFSFHPVKHIACGEGGMITTNDPELYKKLQLLRTHGITKDPLMMEQNDGGWYYEMQVLGYNYRMTEFQAALGISQLKRAVTGLAKRKEIAEIYFSAFRDMPGIIGQSGVVEGHAYHLYIIEVENRKELYAYLKANNIYCQVHYIPVHFLPYYRSLGSKKGDAPFAEKYYTQCLSLPMYPTLLESEQTFVIETIRNFFK